MPKIGNPVGGPKYKPQWAKDRDADTAVRGVSLEHKQRVLANLEMLMLRKALFMCASHCQGGHSEAGAAAAQALGVPFPIRMAALVKKAESEGFKQDDLWPWLRSMQSRKSV